MKQTLPFFVSMFLIACQTGYNSIDDQQAKVLLGANWEKTLPSLELCSDKAVNILLNDTVTAGPANFPTLPMSEDCIDDAVMVPLGRTPDFHIQSIEQIESDDGLFFVLAREQSVELRNGKPFYSSENGCFIFDHRGKFLTKVGRTKAKPKGKGEMMRQIYHLCIDRKRKEIILEGTSDQFVGDVLFYYNYKGKFLRKQTSPIGTFLQEPQVVGDRFVQTWNVNLGTDIYNAPRLMLYDEKSTPVSRALLRPSLRSSCYESGKSLVSSRDGLYYAPLFSDTIWQITPEKVIARYVISGPIIGSTVNPYRQDSLLTPKEWFMSQKNRLCRNAFCISPDFLLLGFGYYTDVHWEREGATGVCAMRFLCLLDRTTNHTCWLRTNKTTALRQEFYLDAFCITEDGLMVCCQSVEELKRSVAYDSSYITDKEKAFIKRLKMDDNPVLLLAKLKHF